MSKTKTIKHLEELEYIIQTTKTKIDEGYDINEALKTMNIGFDKKLGAIVRDLGGESFYYNKSNATSFGLAMGVIT